MLTKQCKSSFNNLNLTNCDFIKKFLPNKFNFKKYKIHSKK